MVAEAPAEMEGTRKAQPVGYGFDLVGRGQQELAPELDPNHVIVVFGRLMGDGLKYLAEPPFAEASAPGQGGYATGTVGLRVHGLDGVSDLVLMW